MYLKIFFVMTAFFLSLISGQSPEITRNRLDIKFIPIPGQFDINTKSLSEKNYPILGTSDRSILKEKMSSKTAAKIVDWYVESVESFYKNNYGIKFPEVFSKNKELRRIFWEAFDPRYDSIEETVKLLDKLNSQYPKQVAKYPHFAVATVVSWDDLKSVISIRNDGLSKDLKRQQFKAPMKMEETFAFLTNPGTTKRMVQPLDKQSWPALTFIAALMLKREEADWALEKYYPKRKRLETTYNDVEYDENVLRGRKAGLTGKEYTLQNILKYTGVSADKAHFAANVAKIFGIPAMKTSGWGISGVYHGRANMPIFRRGKYKIVSAGEHDQGLNDLRISGVQDRFYEGRTVLPQSGAIVSEDEVKMLFYGLSQSYKKYTQARILGLIAEELVLEDPKLSTDLIKGAIKINPYAPKIWEALRLHMEKKKMTLKTKKKWLSQAMQKLKKYPTVVYEIFGEYIKHVPAKSQTNEYKKMLKYFAKRPDLTSKTQLDQCKSLVARDKFPIALQYGLKYCRDNAQHGYWILPIFKMGYKPDEAALKNPKVQLLIFGTLKKVDSKMPRDIKGKGTAPCRLAFDQIMTQVTKQLKKK